MEGIRQDTRQAVERLEGQVARLRAAVWILFLALLGAVGAYAWLQLHPKAAPGVVKMNGLVIESGSGAAKVLITPRGLSITDDQGQSRVDLSVSDKGDGQLALDDAQGAPGLVATPAGLALTNAKKDGASLTTAGGATIQLRRGDKVVFKQPWDAPDLK